MFLYKNLYPSMEEKQNTGPWFWFRTNLSPATKMCGENASVLILNKKTQAEPHSYLVVLPLLTKPQCALLPFSCRNTKECRKLLFP